MKPGALAGVGARLRAARYKAMVRTCARFAPYYVINEYPKCGGTWLSQMLSDAMSMPFYRHRMPRLKPGIVHGHFLSSLGLANTLVIWRDPRDLCVSLYHHCYFENELHNASLVRKMKQRQPFDDYRDVVSNLPAFIRFMTETPVAPRFTWDTFVSKWARRRDVVHTSYEVLRRNTAAELQRLVYAISGRELCDEAAARIAEDQSFEKAKARVTEGNRGKPAETSFVRQGAVGGWRKYFNAEAVRLAETHWAEGLDRLGYDL